MYVLVSVFCAACACSTVLIPPIAGNKRTCTFKAQGRAAGAQARRPQAQACAFALQACAHAAHARAFNVQARSFALHARADAAHADTFESHARVVSAQVRSGANAKPNVVIEREVAKVAKEDGKQDGGRGAVHSEHKGHTEGTEHEGG